MSHAVMTARRTFEWQRYPQAENAVGGWIEAALGCNEFAARLAQRMRDETATRFVDWVDHLVLTDRDGLVPCLEQLGYEREWEVAHDVGTTVFRHPGAIFPRVIVARGDGPAMRTV